VDSADDSEAVTQLHDSLLLRARARVGTVLREKWRLDSLLGVGGMAAVYAATHRNGSRVAVKILHPELSLNAQVKTRFLREGYVSNSVGHEGAVRVSDDDTADDGSAFLVMDLLDGETLEDRRVRFGGRLPEDDVLSVAEQLLDVLAAAHAKGIVHRDLKPENVFLTRTGQVKVLDFGIARLRELSTASTATKGGSTMGTPAFMSPEQARGLWEEVDAQSDLWACGALMFTLLSGREVHGGRTSNEQLLSAMTRPAPSLSTILPDVGVAVAHVVDRALAFDKDKRWRDAHRMQEAVRRAYNDRNHAPITTAPRLTVPETVPDRTLPSSKGPLAPRLPTTGRPVAGTLMHLVTLIHWARPSRVLGVAAAVAVGIVVTVVSLAARNHHAASTPPPNPVASQAPATSAPMVQATLVEAVPAGSAAPVVAATDLPAASSAKPPAKPVAAVRPTSTPPPPAATAAPVKPGCNPPYVLEPGGKRKWKPECLY
jgi:eukaryotic-like serine/threonine-protein kinase